VAILRHNELIHDTPVIVRHLLIEQRARIVGDDTPVAELQRLLSRGVDAVAGDVANTVAVLNPRVERRRPTIARCDVHGRVWVVKIVLRGTTRRESIP
jgi:hypothetical protein